MESVLRYLATILISTTLLTGNAVYTNVNNQNDRPVTDEVTIQQTKGQIDFFKQALDELGATTPEQVAKTWAKAEETRNGVFHYAVACDELKSKIIKEWGKPEDSFWIIGQSSPWLDRYEIVNSKKLNDSSYEVTIKYYWITSGGPSETTQNTLTIVKNKDIWCVKEVK